jgi:hypothetical protein
MDAKQSLRARVMSGLVGAMLLAAPVASAQAAPNSNPGVLPPTSHPFGKTYGEWSAAWWQWAVSFPTGTSPLTHTDATSCARGQSGPVWYLSADLTGVAKPPPRVCTIPAGKGILFPIINAEWSVAEANVYGNACQVTVTPSGTPVPGGTSDAALQACAIALMDYVTSLEADFDGTVLQNLDPISTPYRFTSPAFIFDPVTNNPFAIPSGTTRSVANGFWVLLAPPTAGQHKLHFRGEAKSLGAIFEAMYTLTIVG